MQFFLSWKQKFRLLIGITLLSLALMAASSFWASLQLSASLQAREDAKGYASASISLMNDWLKLGAQRQALSPATQDNFQQRLSALEQLAKQFVVQAQGLGDASISQSARQIEELLLTETALQRDWLELSQQLGLPPFEGMRQTLSTSAQSLEPINIGLIQPFIAAALRNQRDYLSTFDSGYADQTQSAIDDMQAKIEELDWQENQIGQAVSSFSAAFSQAHALILKIREAEQRIASLGQQIEQRIDEQNVMLQDGILASTARQAQQASRSSNWIMGLSFTGVALFLLLTLSQASRTLMAQLNNVTQILSQVASGNLTGTLTIGRNPKDEFNQLAEASNRMIEGISRIVRQVIDANRELTELHRYLSESMRRLGDNSSQVEIQTEQAASASQQISATINEMAQRTSDVGNATHTAYDSARMGSTIIDASVASMRRLAQLIQATHAQVALLSQSSSKVAGIIDVINSLADQTNLLALNAAIEAARAGDAGRGFSVVADEVRSLALKTVAATTDIAGIVGEFKQQTQRMNELMTSGLSLAAESERHSSQVAETIDEITRSMEQLSGEMNQVVVAIEEISSTTEDIAGKMEDINLHTGETKGLRVTLDQHTHGLSVQVEALSRSARQFQVS
ncbi:methyl-accepting chemotaxis protein [Pseudomonas sp. UBA2684]|uniref:methyl-accepting chemotaxis protein n=1 Tax=Pseudomonas sp. UBA2684 TaxID=1947311 RepID=UPI000E969F24|nr:methyl-accepting chemotaxis protein [Pseudomonas sp. UBA2684]HBX56705.1 chemotaxis protein [Pseudomonas sp.]|tara:strand:+ start:22987 stop:24870 length:1884 start_codon:yes stop_codon:yes gene_type:complete